MDTSIESLYEQFLKSSGICTDSRNVPDKSIFFALKGDSFDGNRFAKMAIENGAILAIVDNKDYASENCILVDSVLKTLQQLARHHRRVLSTKIIGITGTNGKTTTKELLCAVLSKKYKTVATSGNLNNQIGVPLTLLSLTPDVELAIVEMGANHIDDIAELVSIAEPNYGLITNIGRAHLGGFGSFEGVVRAKTALYTYLNGNEGPIFYNSENSILCEQVEAMQVRFAVPYSRFISHYNIICHNDPYLNIRFSVAQNCMSYGLKTHLVGGYNVENVLAAIAIGCYFGVDVEDAIGAIESYEPANSRSQYVKTAHNTVIMDAYNANPSSVELAIKNFASITANNKVAIIGEMLELGSYSIDEHKKVVHLLEQNGFTNVFLVGTGFKGLQKEYRYFNNADECVKSLKIAPIEKCTVLLKGSRGVRLEKVMEVL